MTRKNPKNSPDYEQYKDVICGPDDDPEIDCMTLEEMIKSYTASGAYEMFTENITGSIECGKSADILVLDRDLENTDIMDVEFTQIKHRIFKGEMI